MKYSLDFSNNNLSGWVATNLHDTSIDIVDSSNNNFITGLDKVRKDVVSKGICDNERCGFSFSNILKKNIEGDIFSFNIHNAEINIIGSKFCGDKEKWRLIFDDFQVSDRNDFTIQDCSMGELFNSHPDIIAFKILMIRLRRGKRSFSYRGEFKGHEYPLMQSDWEFFKSYYIKHFDSLSKILSVRSLWSVIDTFVDFGSPIEKSCALAISNYMYQERFAQTYAQVFEMVPLQEAKMKGQAPYWGGMLSNNLTRDDAYDVFMTKNIEVLEYAPIIKKTFAVIFLEAINNSYSIISMNSSNSMYFKAAFKFYKNYFSDYLIK